MPLVLKEGAVGILKALFNDHRHRKAAVHSAFLSLINGLKQAKSQTKHQYGLYI